MKGQAVKVVLGAESGPHSEIQSYDLILKVPPSLKLALKDAAGKKRGILKCDISESMPAAYHNLMWER